MLSRLLVAAFAASSVVSACTNCTNESPEPIVLSPAPWELHGDIYGLFLLPGVGIPLLGNSIPAKAFPPLERSNPASTAGKFAGRLGMIQVIRYTDSPVGPYDELLILPGFFDYENNGTKEEGIRVSRIYVSQKYTCWNGRTNWNIPKHLARFDWTFTPEGAATVKVYPFDTSGDPTESGPSEKPFFQMTFAPLLPENLLDNTLSALLPNVLPDGLNLNLETPFTTDLYSLFGIDATLKQPPVPQADDAYGALAAGGPYWKSVVPGQFTRQASFGTVNMDQSGGDGEEEGVNAVGDEFYQNFWPGLLPVSIGVRMLNALITFGEATDLPDIVA